MMLRLPAIFVLMMLFYSKDYLSSAQSYDCRDRFLCAEDLCILHDWVCDGEEDCPGGIDERNCIETSLGNKTIKNKSEDANSATTNESSYAVLTTLEPTKIKTTKRPSFFSSTASVPRFLLNEKNLRFNQTEDYEISQESSNVSVAGDNINYEFGDYNSSEWTEEKSNTTALPEDTDIADASPTKNTEIVPVMPTFMTGTTDTAESKFIAALRPLEGERTKSQVRKVRKTDSIKRIDFESLPHLKLLIEMTKKLTSLSEEIKKGAYKDPKNSSCSVEKLEEKKLISKLTCPKHFEFIAGYCIYVQIYPPLTWDEADSLCESHGSKLISIPNNLILKKLLQQLSHDRQRGFSLWVGAYKHGNGVWKWLNGDPVKHYLSLDLSLFFLERNPLPQYLHAEANQKRQCVFLDGNRSSLLTKGNCHVQKGFICKREIKPTIPIPYIHYPVSK